MEWLPVAVALALFIFFPRNIFIAACVIAAIGAAVYGYLHYDEWKTLKDEEAVTVTIEYLPAECSEDSPLKITIDNASSRTVANVTWDISVREPEGGSELAGTNQDDYLQDKKLKPKESLKICAPMPSLQREIEDFSKLEYSVQNKYVSFQ